MFLASLNSDNFLGREIISNLAKAAGLATMISVMRPDIDSKLICYLLIIVEHLAWENYFYEIWSCGASRFSAISVKDKD